MYSCASLYTCVYTLAHVHVHTHACAHFCMHAYTHVYVHVYTRVCTHVCTHAYTRVANARVANASCVWLRLTFFRHRSRSMPTANGRGTDPKKKSADDTSSPRFFSNAAPSGPVPAPSALAVGMGRNAIKKGGVDRPGGGRRQFPVDAPAEVVRESQGRRPSRGSFFFFGAC